MLHFQRKPQKQLAEREAAGENLWTTAILPPVAMRIVIGWLELSNREVIERHAEDAFRHVLLESGADLTQMVSGTYASTVLLSDVSASVVAGRPRRVSRAGFCPSIGAGR
ncbi:MAG TPA: hypothetical protein VIK54_10220 [Acidimicrobiia bacterium]